MKQKDYDGIITRTVYEFSGHEIGRILAKHLKLDRDKNCTYTFRMKRMNIEKNKPEKFLIIVEAVELEKIE